MRTATLTAARDCAGDGRGDDVEAVPRTGSPQNRLQTRSRRVAQTGNHIGNAQHRALSQSEAQAVDLPRTSGDGFSRRARADRARSATQTCSTMCGPSR